MVLPRTGLIGLQRTLDPYYQGGTDAQQLLAAQSGALGADAQQQAFDDFIASPGQQYLRDQSEQAILRNAAATGGLQGGNVLQALQQNAIGLAAQDLQNQQNVLGALAQGGLSAGSQLGAGQQRAGELIANNLSGTAGNIANLLTGSTGNLQQLLAGLGGVSVPGIQQTQGNIGGLGQLASGIGTGLSIFSDLRLKENLTKIGETLKGHNLYTWDWTEEAKDIVGGQPPIGVIAQEVEQTQPEAVHEKNGYLAVNYQMVM